MPKVADLSRCCVTLWACWSAIFATRRQATKYKSGYNKLHSAFSLYTKSRAILCKWEVVTSNSCRGTFCSRSPHIMRTTVLSLDPVYWPSGTTLTRGRDVSSSSVTIAPSREGSNKCIILRRILQHLMMGVSKHLALPDKDRGHHHAVLWWTFWTKFKFCHGHIQKEWTIIGLLSETQICNSESVQKEPNGPLRVHLVPFVHSQSYGGPCKWNIWEPLVLVGLLMCHTL